MKTLLSFLKRQAVPLLVLILALAAGWYFRAPLAAWFKPTSTNAAASPHTGHDHGSHSKTAPDPAPPAATPPSKPINGLCPIQGNPVPEDAITVQWNGHVIGFCCGGCDVDWEALSEEKKKSFVEKSLATAKPSAPAAASDPTKPINAVCPILEDPIPDDAKTVTWNGHVIGFCCPPCEADWNALPEDKKKAFVEKSLAAATSGGPAAAPAKTTRPAPKPEDIAFHTCSMHPSVKSKDPGTCPICKMDLTPVTYEEVREGIIFVDNRRRKLINLRTAPVEKRALTREVRAVGRITYDETTLRDITLKTDAWIGEVHADFTGREVKTGEPLLTYYSPEVLSVQQDLIDSAASGDSGRRLAESARERLRLFDLRDAQITALAASGKAAPYLPLLAPADGTIIEKMAVAGSSIMAGKMLYRLADLRRVWVQVAVYESDIALIQQGQTAKLTLSHLPGVEVEGSVAFIDPWLDPKTRTARARIVVENPDGRLKPDLFAVARIQVDLGEHPAIPAEAVLHAGESDIAFLDLGEDRIRPQKIALGHRAGDWMQVREGLKPGDVIVTSGNFLIASEAKLKSGKDTW